MATSDKNIERRKDILDGTSVFRGTRGQVSTFFEYLEAGHSIPEFLEDFPTVPKEQAIQSAFLIKRFLRFPILPIKVGRLAVYLPNPYGSTLITISSKFFQS